MINKELAKRMNLSEYTIKQIELHHILRKDLEDRMAKEEDTAKLKMLSGTWTENEFALQKLWGFKQDINYHKSWWLPKCTCPKMDNDDAYPLGYYTRIAGCPIHG